MSRYAGPSLESNSLNLQLIHDPNKFNPLFSDFNTVLNYVQRSYAYVTEGAVDFEEADLSKEVEEMEATTKFLIDLESELNTQKNVMERLREKTLNREHIPSLTEYYDAELNTFKRKYNSTPDKIRYGRNSNYTDFKQKVWEVKNPDTPMPSLGASQEDDLIISTEKISLMCPLTTAIFEEPVTSLKCKHSFSRAAILEHLKRLGGQAQCPNPGCNKLITENDLKPNKHLARKVAIYRAQGESDEDDDEYENVE